MSSANRADGSAARPTAEERAWLPDLCRLPTLFSTLAAAQVAVLVVWLAPTDGPGWSARQLLAASLFAQWLALCSAVVLCKARVALSRWPAVAGALAAWSIPVVVAWLGSLLIHELDNALGFGLGLALPLRWHFAGHIALIAGLLAASLLRYFYVQDASAAQERAQSRAEVDALQARIRPHFLFNSMNTIASLIRRDPVTAERVVEDLADLFRAALRTDSTTSLGDELDLCRRYLAIEQLRLADRLQVDIVVDPQVPLDLPLPRLLLQPLVENAVHHGVARLAAGGVVQLRVAREARVLRIEIRNPCPPGSAQPGDGNRHAVSNIAQRLAFHFGDHARMVRWFADGYYHCRLTLPITGQ